jgi:hypothetical protein
METTAQSTCRLEVHHKDEVHVWYQGRWGKKEAIGLSIQAADIMDASTVPMFYVLHVSSFPSGLITMLRANKEALSRVNNHERLACILVRCPPILAAIAISVITTFKFSKKYTFCWNETELARKLAELKSRYVEAGKAI